MISIGADPGFHCGLTWLDVTTIARPTLIETRSLEVGHKVALAKPKTFKDGRTQKEETVLGHGDWCALFGYMRELFAELLSHPAAVAGGIVLTVEGVEKVAGRERQAKQSQAQASTLMLAQRIGSEIAAVGRCAFGPERVRYETEDAWRTAVIGRGGHNNENAAVALVIKQAIAGWPKVSNNHQRDAAGVALFGARRAHMMLVRDKLNSIGRIS